MSEAIVETYFPGLHLAPARLVLSEFETETAVNAGRGVAFFEKLSKAIQSVESNYDVVVIDIRHPDEVEDHPLTLSGETLTIPFFSLKTQFYKLDASKQYLLYCEKGVMSKLHAMYLAEEGFANVGVYKQA